MRQTLLSVDQAARQLHHGSIIAYPTEAVFGLGCDPANEAAVRQLLLLKTRPESAGLILIGSAFSQFDGWLGPVSDAEKAIALASWPGPVTWLFPRGSKVPDFIAGQHSSIAIRITGHPSCVALCDAFGGPIVSTSANPHSAPPARSAGQVEEYFGGAIGGIMEGDLGKKSKPSTIRDLRTGKVLRGG